MPRGDGLLALAGVAAAGAATGVAVQRVRRADREIGELAAQARRQDSYIRELQTFSRRRTDVVERTDDVALAVEAGTTIARFGHHAIASIPFTILEWIPVTRHTTKAVHAVHDTTADSVYTAIGVAARGLRRQVRRQLSGETP